jgi:hypothetical protein
MTAKLEPIRDPADAHYLDRVGIILTGTREIGRYMGVSAMTILRWHERFRGTTDPRLCFPMLWTPTGKGRGGTFRTHTALIAEWMRRWSEIDTRGRLTRAKRPRKREETLQIGVTREKMEGPATVEGKPKPLRETPAPIVVPCTCGTPVKCFAH